MQELKTQKPHFPDVLATRSQFKAWESGYCVRFAWQERGRAFTAPIVAGGHVGFSRGQRRCNDFGQRFLETTYLRAQGSEVIGTDSLRIRPFLVSWMLAAVFLTVAQSALPSGFVNLWSPIVNPFLLEHPRAFSIFLSKSLLIQQLVPTVKARVVSSWLWTAADISSLFLGPICLSGVALCLRDGQGDGRTNQPPLPTPS